MADEEVEWSVTKSDDTTYSGTSAVAADGTLTVAADETEASLKVVATSKTTNTVKGTATVTVATEITDLSITGLSTALAVDGTIPTIVSGNDTQYSVAATWTKDSSPASAGDTIAAGEYVLTLVFTPKAGYAFPAAGIATVSTDGSGLTVEKANDADEGTLKFTITITVAS